MLCKKKNGGANKQLDVSWENLVYQARQQKKNKQKNACVWMKTLGGILFIFLLA